MLLFKDEISTFFFWLGLKIAPGHSSFYYCRWARSTPLEICAHFSKSKYKNNEQLEKTK